MIFWTSFLNLGIKFPYWKNLYWIDVVFLSILVPTLYVLTCKGIECGLACKSPNFGEGVCDGEGFCVSAEENPCSEQGCDGKACGEQCLSGDIVGACSAQGDCEFNPDNVKCGKLIWLMWSICQNNTL